MDDLNHISRQKDLIRKIKSRETVAAKMSFVPMHGNYSQDPFLCLTSVSFMPSPIASIIRNNITARLIAAEDSHFYYPDESFHVTVKNIRRLADPPSFGKDEIATARRLLADEVPRHGRVRFSFEDLILFPSSVSLVGYCDETFSNLVRALHRRLSAAGLPDDKSYASNSVFFGNVTLCRLTDVPSERFVNAVDAIKLRQPIEVCVTEIELVSCDAVCDPRRVERHGTFRLRQKA